MNLGHRQEVRSSWEGAGSQSQGLTYVQPVQDSLSVRSLYANGIPEGNQLQIKTPSFSHSAALTEPGQEELESFLEEQKEFGVHSCNLSTREAEAGDGKFKTLSQ